MECVFFFRYGHSLAFGMLCIEAVVVEQAQTCFRKMKDPERGGRTLNYFQKISLKANEKPQFVKIEWRIRARNKRLRSQMPFVANKLYITWRPEPNCKNVEKLLLFSNRVGRAWRRELKIEVTARMKELNKQNTYKNCHHVNWQITCIIYGSNFLYLLDSLLLVFLVKCFQLINFFFQ